jgi:hypothetical protein
MTWKIWWFAWTGEMLNASFGYGALTARNFDGRRFEIACGANEPEPEMMRPLIRVSLFDATSENDFTLLEENGEYFVNFADRTGTYREFLRMLSPEDELHSDLVTGDVTANFFALMKEVSERWNDQMKVQVLHTEPGDRIVGNRRKPEKMKRIVERIVSGGQTGADRAALDFAIEHGLKHGGWCPKGRRAEDGRIPGRYELKETQATSYVQRTEWNVRDSDGTVIFTVMTRLTGGSKKTANLARKHRKPCLHLSAGETGDPVEELRAFIQSNGIKVLNVAGSRASKEPAVGDFVMDVLSQVLVGK